MLGRSFICPLDVFARPYSLTLRAGAARWSHKTHLTRLRGCFHPPHPPTLPTNSYINIARLRNVSARTLPTQTFLARLHNRYSIVLRRKRRSKVTQESHRGSNADDPGLSRLLLLPVICATAENICQLH